MDITIKQATDRLFEELRKDKDLYYAYQANIAMAFKDEFHRHAGPPGEMVHVNSDELHVIANQAAKNFLDLLIFIPLGSKNQP